MYKHRGNASQRDYPQHHGRGHFRGQRDKPVYKTDPHREQLQPKSPAAFNQRLSEITSVIADTDQDTSAYMGAQNFAALKSQLYKSGFTNTVIEILPLTMSCIGGFAS